MRAHPSRLSLLFSLLLGLRLSASLPAPAPIVPEAQRSGRADCEAAWSVVRSLNGSGDSNSLSDLAVVTAGDVWAVGDTGDGINVLDTLIEHWNGTGWTYNQAANEETSDSIIAPGE